MEKQPRPANGRLFCSRPFRLLEVHGGSQPKGHCFLCCPSWLPTEVGNMLEQPIEEVWNGPEARAVRRSILDGSFSHCRAERCPSLQNVSGPVRRADEVTDPEMRRVLDQQLTRLPWLPRQINCAYDRSCNLSCPSCRQDVVVESDREQEIMALQEKLSNEASRSVRRLYITGSGDPFGSPYFRRWLFSMDIETMPELRCIHLHTNALAWTRSHWERIPPPVRARIRTAEISIDAATEATYALNRRGGSFPKLLSNLAFIAGLRRDGPLEQVRIHMVVQANNYREMPAFLTLGRRFGFDRVYFSRLEDWGTFSRGEYEQRAVHLATHHQHQDLLDVVRNPCFDTAITDMGNLARLRSVPHPVRSTHLTKWVERTG